MEKKVLVLGADSFIAGYFIRNLKGKEIFGITRSDFCLQPKRKNITVIGNFDYKPESFLSVFNQFLPEWIINFVGARKPEKEQNDFNYLFYVNCQITQMLLEAIKRIKRYKPKIILIGSAAEYGVSYDINQVVFKEDSPTKPITCYGLTKIFQTGIGLYYSHVYDQRINIVRLANVVGFGLPKGFFLSDILEQITEGNDKLVVDDLSSVRDFIGVEEVVEGLTKIFEQEKTGEVINLSSGRGTVLREVKAVIINYFREREGREICIEEKSLLSSKPNYSILDNSKLSKLTGFRPSCDINRLLVGILEKPVTSESQ